jgi:hypothetical protein
MEEMSCGLTPIPAAARLLGLRIQILPSCACLSLASIAYIIHQAFEDGPDRGFRNVGQYKPDAGESPKS